MEKKKNLAEWSGEEEEIRRATRLTDWNGAVGRVDDVDGVERSCGSVDGDEWRGQWLETAQRERAGTESTSGGGRRLCNRVLSPNSTLGFGSIFNRSQNIHLGSGSCAPEAKTFI